MSPRYSYLFLKYTKKCVKENAKLNMLCNYNFRENLKELRHLHSRRNYFNIFDNLYFILNIRFILNILLLILLYLHRFEILFINPLQMFCMFL